jgi:hypothetical protein
LSTAAFADPDCLITEVFMRKSSNVYRLLQTALSSVIFAACAADVGDEPTLSDPAPQQTSSPVYTPPQGARMLPADPSLSVEAALARLHSTDTQKIQPGLSCDETWRVIEASGWGDNLVTAEVNWAGQDKGILRASVPWAEYGSVTEGFLLCAIGDDEAIYSMGAGRFVSVELDEGDWNGDWAATLRARATYVDSWERFRITRDGLGSIRSRANNRFVTAEFHYPGDGYATLRARSSVYEEWQQFRIR